MAFINAMQGPGNFVRVHITTLATYSSDVATATTNLNNVFQADNTNGVSYMQIPALQEITVNATPGLFRWQQLDALSEFVVTTPSTNSLGMSMVVDPGTFFTGPAGTGNAGLFDLTNNKTQIGFRVYWQGNESGETERYVQGFGYLSGTAPTVTPSSPVWVSPVTIEVTGDYITGSWEVGS